MNNLEDGGNKVTSLYVKKLGCLFRDKEDWLTQMEHTCVQKKQGTALNVLT